MKKAFEKVNYSVINTFYNYMKHSGNQSIILSLLLIAFAASCHQQNKSEKSVSSDSVATAQATPTKPSMSDLMLPDTMYASVGSVEFRVIHSDSVDHPLKDFEDRYERSDRVMTFRKNLLRNADFGGTVKGTPSQIEIAWVFTTPYGIDSTRFGRWGGGTGWTGQPLYAHWSEDEMKSFREQSPALTSDFGEEEIMVGSLCGKAFFINYQTGRASRQPLDLHNIVKGTMSLDPELMNLYSGQGVPKGEPIGCQAFDLLTHKRNFFFSDAEAWRGWNAFDSSPIVAGGYLFWPGENSSLYKFERLPGGQLRKLSTLRYRVHGTAPGIESSLCVYRNYGFFSDNHGNVFCVNLNTMRPVWYYDNHDDSDGTMVCREEQGVPYIYTACEVDKQGAHGQCHFIKLRALDGTLVWERLIDCHRVELPGKTLDGGMYASPLIGCGDCEDMIFANICRNGASPSRGELTAISTHDGSILWTVPYGNFCWSSPVCFLNENNEMFIFTGNASGRAYLVRGITGEVLATRDVGYNFESSPCVVGNTAVVGTRGTNIYKFVIK